MPPSNTELDEPTKPVAQHSDGESQSKSSTSSHKLDIGISASAKSNIRMKLNLNTAPETNSQTNLQSLDISLAEPAPQANQDFQRRTERIASTTVKNLFNAELTKHAKRQLSPEPEEHETKRQKPLVEEDLKSLALIPVKPEEPRSPVLRPSTEEPAKSGHVPGTESLTKAVISMNHSGQESANIREQAYRVQYKEESRREATRDEDDEASVAAATLLDFSRGAREVNAHVAQMRTLLGEDEEVVDDEDTTAATMLINLSRGTEVAAHPKPARPAHLVTSPSKMDPPVGRLTRSTPREGDYAALMNFMKPDDAEGDELRAKKRREKRRR